MVVIEYILDPQDKPRLFAPKTVPSYVSDGGYFMNLDGSEKMIGVGVEDSIPDNITTFSLEELQARQRAIHTNYPMKKVRAGGIDLTPSDVGYLENMTDDEVDDIVKEWWDARS